MYIISGVSCLQDIFIHCLLKHSLFNNPSYLVNCVDCAQPQVIVSIFFKLSNYNRKTMGNPQFWMDKNICILLALRELAIK